MIMDNLLINSGKKEECIACFEETEMAPFCCKAPICKNCYFTWLKSKRQCMHCKIDQCDFDIWYDNYRDENAALIDEDPELRDIIHIDIRSLQGELISELTLLADHNYASETTNEILNFFRQYQELFQQYQESYLYNDI